MPVDAFSRIGGLNSGQHSFVSGGVRGICTSVRHIESERGGEETVRVKIQYDTMHYKIHNN